MLLLHPPNRFQGSLKKRKVELVTMQNCGRGVHDLDLEPRHAGHDDALELERGDHGAHQGWEPEHGDCGCA